MDKIAKIGIIGAGHIAEKMAVTLLGMEGVELYAIAARDVLREQPHLRKSGALRKATVRTKRWPTMRRWI